MNNDRLLTEAEADVDSDELEDDEDQIDEAVIAADDTGMISGERLITEAELDPDDDRDITRR